MCAFVRNPVPGVNEILIVPAASGSSALQLTPFSATMGLNGKWQQPLEVGFFDRISKDQIRQEILDGMQAAVDAICTMRARPSEIKAKASAAGIVEVEVTWISAEVCG